MLRTRALVAAATCVTSLMACGGGTPTPVSSADKASVVDVVGECKATTKEGNPAPKMKVPTMNGAGTIEVGSGKVTLIDFWATWCGPCRESFPKYQDLYVKYKASGLEIVAISLDDADTKGEILQFVKSTDVKFPVGWDGAKKIPPCFDISNMPTAYLIDRKGIVRHVHRGFRKNEERDIEREIKELL